MFITNKYTSLIDELIFTNSSQEPSIRSNYKKKITSIGDLIIIKLPFRRLDRHSDPKTHRLVLIAFTPLLIGVKIVRLWPGQTVATIVCSCWSVTTTCLQPLTLVGLKYTCLKTLGFRSNPRQPNSDWNGRRDTNRAIGFYCVRTGRKRF